MDGEKGCRGPARVALDRWHDQLEPWEKEVLERMLEAYKGGMPPEWLQTLTEREMVVVLEWIPLIGAMVREGEQGGRDGQDKQAG